MGKKIALIANRTGARFFSVKTSGDIELIKAIEHPEGRLKNQEIDSDRQGYSTQSGSPGRNSYSKEVQATEHVLEKFVKSLNKELDEQLQNTRADGWILAAEPHFLGKFLAETSALAKKSLVSQVTKDLCNVKDNEIATYIMR